MSTTAYVFVEKSEEYYVNPLLIWSYACVTLFTSRICSIQEVSHLLVTAVALVLFLVLACGRVVVAHTRSVVFSITVSSSMQAHQIPTSMPLLASVA